MSSAMMSANILTPATGIASAHACDNTRKCKRCVCGFDITGLSEYHVSENWCSNSHKKAVRCLKLPRLNSFFCLLPCSVHACSPIPWLSSLISCPFLFKATPTEQLNVLISQSSRNHQDMSQLTRLGMINWYVWRIYHVYYYKVSIKDF